MACDRRQEAPVMVWLKSALEANHNCYLGELPKVNDTEGKGIGTVCFEYKSQYTVLEHGWELPFSQQLQGRHST